MHARVVDRLQSLLKGEEATEISTREIMEYFFNRLQSHDIKERDHAVKVVVCTFLINRLIDGHLSFENISYIGLLNADGPFYLEVFST